MLSIALVSTSYEDIFINYLKDNKFEFKVFLKSDGIILFEFFNISSDNFILKNFVFPYILFIDCKSLSLSNFKGININNQSILNGKNFLIEWIGKDFLNYIKDKIVDKKIFFNILRVLYFNDKFDDISKNEKKEEKKISEEKESKDKNNFSEKRFKIIRAKKEEEILLKNLKKKVSRVTKFFVDDFSLLEYDSFENYLNLRIGFVALIYKDKIYYSFKMFYFGQKRMKFDKNSPSRSFLKIEEAFKLFCLEPKEFDIVFDLGASPGGWSYASVKRGAIVYSIDNGNLKGSYLKEKIKMKNIFHIKKDAFKFNPQVDLSIKENILRKNFENKSSWFLCDIVEKPEKIVKLAFKWVQNKWAYFFIINFKIGFTSFNQFFNEIRKVDFLKYFESYRFVHLFSDREEITFIGYLKN